MPYRIGIDLGGTKTEAVLINERGDELRRERRPTPASEGYDAILANVTELVNTIGHKAGPDVRIGVGTPGALSARTGLLKNSNTTCMNGRPLKADLEQRLGRMIRMANDANCFALSEAVDGAGRDGETVLGIILGTGVGGGIVFRKHVHQGPQHIAGEWGHNVLEADGPPCYCGKRGCVETFLSGPGLLRDYRQAGGDVGSDTRAIADRARAGDPCAREAMHRYLDRFGRALSVVINILDPDVIVLGGGMSNIDELYSEGPGALARYIFNDEVLTPIVRNDHGDSAGVLGAARLWPAAD